MLSTRGTKYAKLQDIPWRFPAGGKNCYDKDSNPSGVISLATAENYLCADELQKFILENVTIPKEAYTYGYGDQGGLHFPIALSSFINNHFSPSNPVQPDEIITGASLTPINELLGRSLGNPGDGILVARPVYGGFELDFGNTAELEMVYADMKPVDPFEEGERVVVRYQAALESAKGRGRKVVAVMVVNPHNPLGRCFNAETLRALMAFCERNKLHMVSDEVYALSVYDEGENGFVSALSVKPDEVIRADRLHVLYGMSKDFAAPGLRIGSLITRNQPLRNAISVNVRFHEASGPSLAIATAILSNEAFTKEFVILNRSRLQERRKVATDALDSVGVKYHSKANAGFFLYLDLRPWMLLTGVEDTGGSAQEFELAQRLLDAGVGLHPCEEHGEEKGFFRLVFTREKGVLEEGLRR
ncbi:1-aminocyclopropane-1-carboxylate synthase [Amylocarpus encephaloides]|uniref:1-aminocyclopropane-1-carboxylate synthase n=1 Tax=Amylocarpus encephaloides TaxID=45428 RepID=A0A9P8C7R2_9HELO|nr:1-aminocyclopropane-1-carboxylate synthase [Amylocarpus encephaloides]